MHPDAACCSGAHAVSVRLLLHYVMFTNPVANTLACAVGFQVRLNTAAASYSGCTMALVAAGNVGVRISHDAQDYPLGCGHHTLTRLLE